MYLFYFNLIHFFERKVLSIEYFSISNEKKMLSKEKYIEDYYI